MHIMSTVCGNCTSARTGGVKPTAAAASRPARHGGPALDGVLYPTVRDGLKGVQFVSACVKSSARNAAWVPLDH